MTLTWGLLVATKDRLDPLKHCIGYALAQNRLPSEVVIVDASAEWEMHKAEITTLLSQHPEIRFVYEPAPKPSLTVQRNCALDQATADIVFMLDDDSYLYPDAAEKIMAHYEADQGKDLVGIELRPADRAPGADAVAEPGRRPWFARLRDAIRSADDDRSLVGRARNWLAWRFDGFWRRMMIIGTDQWFLPYDSRYPRSARSPVIATRAIQPTRLFEGYRMTFRRAPVTAEKFEPLLLYYCPGEDLDLSYRMSRHGGLARANDAWVYHFQSSANRLKHYQVALLETLNQALYMRRNASDQTQARSRFRRHVSHRAIVSILRDLKEKSWNLPKARGTWAGLKLSDRIFKASLEELENFYPDMQTRIVRDESPI